VLAGDLGGLYQIVGTDRLQEGIGGTAYLPGRVPPQGFVELGRREESL
jgi:hypothetical protein